MMTKITPSIKAPPKRRQKPARGPEAPPCVPTSAIALSSRLLTAAPYPTRNMRSSDLPAAVLRVNYTFKERLGW